MKCKCEECYQRRLELDIAGYAVGAFSSLDHEDLFNTYDKLILHAWKR